MWKGGSRIKLIATLGLGALALAWASGALTDARYRSSNMCLSYPRDTIRYEYWYLGSSGPPTFFVPVDIPRMNFEGRATGPGIGVSYLKDKSGPYTYRNIEGCKGTDAGFGLLAFEPEPIGERTTPPGCPSVSHGRTHVVKPDDPEAGWITINCASDPTVPGCRMTDKMPNGWKAGITLPRTHLQEWRAASTAARAFFASTLRDCGRA